MIGGRSLRRVDAIRTVAASGGNSSRSIQACYWASGIGSRHFHGGWSPLLALRCVFSSAWRWGSLARGPPSRRLDRRAARRALGTASVDARPALGRGRIDVDVPIVDWGVRSRPYGAPVGLDLEVRALDRGSIMGALRSAADADRELGRVRTDVGTIVRRELRRSLVIALGGGALGGLFAGALIAAFDRRRWLVTGTVCGLAAAAVVTGVSAATISGLGDDAFREPVFYARGGELPKLGSPSPSSLARRPSATQTPTSRRWPDSSS